MIDLLNNPAASNSTFPIASPQEGTMWFPFKNKLEVNHKISRLRSEGIASIRVGINCAEFDAKTGTKWYDWLIARLSEEFNLILCFDNYHFTSSRIPKNRHRLLEIIEHFIHVHGNSFDTVELWRNHSGRASQNQNENIFSDEVMFTATWLKHMGKKVILGKICPGDFEWITKLVSSQLLKNIDFLEVDKEGEDMWSTNTKFYERTLVGLFQAKGITTKVRTCAKPYINLQISTHEYMMGESSQIRNQTA